MPATEISLFHALLYHGRFRLPAQYGGGNRVPVFFNAGHPKGHTYLSEARSPQSGNASWRMAFRKASQCARHLAYTESYYGFLAENLQFRKQEIEEDIRFGILGLVFRLPTDGSSTPDRDTLAQAVERFSDHSGQALLEAAHERANNRGGFVLAFNDQIRGGLQDVTAMQWGPNIEHVEGHGAYAPEGFGPIDAVEMIHAGGIDEEAVLAKLGIGPHSRVPNWSDRSMARALYETFAKRYGTEGIAHDRILRRLLMMDHVQNGEHPYGFSNGARAIAGQGYIFHGGPKRDADGWAAYRGLTHAEFLFGPRLEGDGPPYPTLTTLFKKGPNRGNESMYDEHGSARKEFGEDHYFIEDATAPAWLTHWTLRRPHGGQELSGIDLHLPEDSFRVELPIDDLPATRQAINQLIRSEGAHGPARTRIERNGYALADNSAAQLDPFRVHFLSEVADE